MPGGKDQVNVKLPPEVRAAWRRAGANSPDRAIAFAGAAALLALPRSMRDRLLAMCNGAAKKKPHVEWSDVVAWAEETEAELTTLLDRRLIADVPTRVAAEVVASADRAARVRAGGRRGTRRKRDNS